jgi:hypothetical protein
MIRHLVCALTLATAVSANATDWNSDLDLLRRELPKMHPNAFHATTREAFDAAIEKLKTDAPSLPPHVVVAEIARIVASIGDGHTRLTIPVDPNSGFFLGHTTTPLPADDALRFHPLPLRFYRYADGLFVTAAENVALRGRRVLRLGTMTADEAITAMMPFVSADNDSGRNLGVAEMLAMPEMLHAAGITSGAKSLEIVTAGGALTLIAPPFGTAVPWLAKDDGRKFGFSYRDGIVHAVIDEIGNEKDETFAAFVNRLMRFVHTRDADALVLDLRRNPGGNGAFNKALVHALIREPKFRKPGHLFALIGRRTFSAATMLCNELEKHTNSFFVGEMSGGKPVGWGDSKKLLLPSSGLTVRVSSLYWQQTDPRDTRPGVGVEMDAPPTSAHPDAAYERVADVVRRSRNPRTLDGTWKGTLIIDWQRVPVEIADRRLRILDLKIETTLPRSGHINTTANAMKIDIRVGDGVAFGTVTTAEGLAFPMVLEQLRPTGPEPRAEHTREGADGLR